MAFSKLTQLFHVRLRTAITVADTQMELPTESWNPTNIKVNAPTYKQKGYPTILADAYIKQLMKVFHTCIHPTQYLPQLFTQDNASQILQAGVYVAEQLLQSMWYLQMIVNKF